jgi:hypothetical protein
VQTCHESIEEVDEQNKKSTFKLFGGDIDEHYKVFKLILEVLDKSDGSAAVKWTIEYEKINKKILILQMAGWTALTNALEILMLILSKLQGKALHKT